MRSTQTSSRGSVRHVNAINARLTFGRSWAYTTFEVLSSTPSVITAGVLFESAYKPIPPPAPSRPGSRARGSAWGRAVVHRRWTRPQAQATCRQSSVDARDQRTSGLRRDAARPRYHSSSKYPAKHRYPDPSDKTRGRTSPSRHRRQRGRYCGPSHGLDAREGCRSSRRSNTGRATSCRCLGPRRRGKLRRIL